MRSNTCSPAETLDGFGALVSPLVGTSLLDAGRPFNFLYLVSAGLGVISLVALLAVFRPWLREEAEAETVDEAPASIVSTLRLSTVHLFAAFILLLVGATDTIGAYISAWLIQERGAPTSAGCAFADYGPTLSRQTSTQSTLPEQRSVGWPLCRSHDGLASGASSGRTSLRRSVVRSCLGGCPACWHPAPSSLCSVLRLGRCSPMRCR